MDLAETFPSILQQDEGRTMERGGVTTTDDDAMPNLVEEDATTTDDDTTPNLVEEDDD